MDAITLTNLEKTYANGTKALQGINLTIKEGDFFGLLGQNGAGKTTIIGILTSLVNKTSGKVSIFTKDIDTDFNSAKSFIGVVPQEMNFNIFEKVFDIVVDQAGYYGIPRLIAEKKAEYLLKELGLWEKKDVPSRTLSGGMKRRLMIARGLVHNPKILILDEPTAGVDVELRRGMWDFLNKLNKEGTTIILTTHYLEEAELLCNTIAIINKGKIIEHTTKKKLLERTNKQSYIITLTKVAKISSSKKYMIKQIDSHTLEIELSKKQTITDLVKTLDKKNIQISSLRNKTNRLEELFLQLIKKGDEK